MARKPLNSCGAVLLVVIFAAPARPQATTTPADTQPAAEAVTATLTPEEIQTRLAGVESATDLADAVKAEAVTAYKQALEQVTAAATWAQKVAEYRKGREAAPADLTTARGNVEKLTTQPATQPTSLPAQGTLAELAQFQASEEAVFSQLKETLAKLEDESRLRSDRRTTIPRLQQDANARLEEINRRLAETPAAGTAAQLQQARRTLLRAQRAAVQEELRAYQEELQLFETRRDVLQARLDEAHLRVAQAEARVAFWRDLVGRRRQQEAEEQQRQTEEELRRAHPDIRALAESNAEKARRRTEISGQIERQQTLLKQVTAEYEQLSQEFTVLKEYANRPELQDLTGPLMRDKQSRLAPLRRYRAEQIATVAAYERALVESEELEPERRALVDLDKAVAERMTDLPETALRPRLESRLRELLRTRAEVVTALQRDLGTYGDLLTQVNGATGRLLGLVAQMDDFVSERVLWVRSSKPLWRTPWPQDALNLAQQLRHMLLLLYEDLRTAPQVYAAAGLIWLLLMVLHRRLRRGLAHTADQVSHPYTDRPAATPRAALLTILLALPGPLWWGLLAWRIVPAAPESDQSMFELAHAVRAGLQRGGITLLSLALLHQIAAHRGLGEAHFRWDSATLKALRRHLPWLMLILPLLALFVRATEAYSDAIWRDSWGRVAFILMTPPAVAFAYLTLHPRRGALGALARRRTSEATQRLRWLLFAVFLLLPVALSTASGLGYHYAAVELARRIGQSVWLGLGVLLLYALAARWVWYLQRRLAIEQARRKRAEHAAARAEEGEGAAETGETKLEDAQLNIGQVTEQTRKLLRTAAWVLAIVAFYLTWVNLLPALRVFDKVTLWSHPVEEVNAAGETITRLELITLGNVVGAALITFVTVLMAKNIPGLLEITILRRLSFDAGSRFATTTICRYIISVIGVVAVFNTLGIGWSKVQWLVAAVSVGLGFGLQEIFANFVSGLILLFERPIRIGDTITIGGTTGTVTRIRIRATTITDWDRKELVIPNKEFVTGQVVNWTLTDAIQRVVIPVGVAYGSDVERAKRILLACADRHERVLEQPKPQAWFVGFGDSTLNLELRVFIGDVSDLLIVRDELLGAIDREFAAAGITIAFPQLDIHIASAPETPTAAAPAEGQRPAPTRGTSP